MSRNFDHKSVLVMIQLAFVVRDHESRLEIFTDHVPILHDSITAKTRQRRKNISYGLLQFVVQQSNSRFFFNVKRVSVFHLVPRTINDNTCQIDLKKCHLGLVLLPFGLLLSSSNTPVTCSYQFIPLNSTLFFLWKPQYILSDAQYDRTLNLSAWCPLIFTFW